ncbi:ATP-binding protein [Pontibacter anaerobius]|uniref:ATP-binding protein n=1 Tax=Pontibacter anaerobius TaxID=2993940 RepID=A0ABT3R9S8_9BACT|nr:ATP-binding protein [Pontibacter anaerobius]MCX2738569.1 ATP-binding protein [Pontibacter anaerobius]
MNNSIRVNCTKKNLKLIRDFVTEYLKALALSDILMNQIVLAVDEICANLIIHANHEDPTKYLTLKIQTLKDQVKFEIADQGAAFESNNYKEPNIQEHIRMGKKGGVGIALVNRIMDKVEFLTEGSQNICLLYKKIK